MHDQKSDDQMPVPPNQERKNPVTKHGKRRSKVEIESDKVKAWEYACQGYPHRVIAQEVNLSRQTVGKYVGEMCQRYAGQRQEKGYNDLEALLQSLDLIEADCWTTKARMDRAIAQEQERRDAINLQRIADAKPPIPNADVALMRFWPKYHALLAREIRKAEETRAKALGIITNRDRSGDADSEAKRAELERLLNTPIQIHMVEPPPPDPSWLTEEDRKALELGKSEDSGGVVPDPLAEDRMEEVNETESDDDEIIFRLD